MAAAVARFEAAPHIAADAQPEAGLEDLRLRTPALRPVGCWCTGCGALQHAACWPGAYCHGCLGSRARRRAQVRRPVRRVGGGPADAAVLRLQRRALLLTRVPQGRLARGPQGRVPAHARARLTGAAARPPALLLLMRACALLGAGERPRCARLDVHRRSRPVELAPAAVSAHDAGARWRLCYGEQPGRLPCTGGALHLRCAGAG